MLEPDTGRSPGSVVLADITQGCRVWRRQGPGFSAQLVAYPPGREMPRHAHRTANITFVLAGSFEEEIDAHDHLCGPLHVVVKPAGTIHATRTGDTGARTLVIEVEGSLEDELRRCHGLFDECRWFHGLSGLAPCVLGLCRGLYQGADEAGENWFARMGRAIAAVRPAPMCPFVGVHVRRAIELMEADRTASTAELADRLGLHPVYLARLFRKRLGCSPGRMRQGLQLAAALDRIVRTDQPLAHVALEAGFADQSHFSRQVKRYAGVSAGVLRRLVRQSETQAIPTLASEEQMRLRSFKRRG